MSTEQSMKDTRGVQNHWKSETQHFQNGEGVGIASRPKKPAREREKEPADESVAGMASENSLDCSSSAAFNLSSSLSSVSVSIPVVTMLELYLHSVFK